MVCFRCIIVNTLQKGDYCSFWRDSPQWARASSFTRFLDHTQRRTTASRSSLDECSARHRDLYLTTRTLSQQTNVHAPGGIRTHNLSSQAAADLRLRPRGHWDRQKRVYQIIIINKMPLAALPIFFSLSVE